MGAHLIQTRSQTYEYRLTKKIKRWWWCRVLPISYSTFFWAGVVFFDGGRRNFYSHIYGKHCHRDEMMWKIYTFKSRQNILNVMLIGGYLANWIHAHPRWALFVRLTFTIWFKLSVATAFQINFGWFILTMGFHFIDIVVLFFGKNGKWFDILMGEKLNIMWSTAGYRNYIIISSWSSLLNLYCTKILSFAKKRSTPLLNCLIFRFKTIYSYNLYFFIFFCLKPPFTYLVCCTGY